MRLIDAISLLDNHTKTIRVRGKLIGYVTYEDISNAPTVDAEPVRHGRWIGDKCSACGEERAWYGCNPHWCPDCGAKMDESQSLFDKCVEDVGDWMKKFNDKMDEEEKE